MFIDKLWDFFVSSMQSFFVPLVCSYFAISSNLFLNSACEKATGLESIANTILAPCHYLIGGQVAKEIDGQWQFTPRYLTSSHIQTALTSFVAVPSFLAGTSLKAIAFLSSTTRANHRSMMEALLSTNTRSNVAPYQRLGIELGKEKQWLQPLGLARRPGDENVLSHEKQALKDVGALLDAAGIPWWVDCGTCLGAYRYGGVIPWDEDIDIAVLLPDFENVQKALNRLDPRKYIVQDWSHRAHPNSFNKIFIRESETLIDIYYYEVRPEKKEIEYVLAYEESEFFPEWVKIRERRFKVPASFETVFPLQNVHFDGICVNVPHDVKKYLQGYYGENPNPAKIFDPKTKQYEKDLTHPYWKRAYAH